MKNIDYHAPASSPFDDPFSSHSGPGTQSLDIVSLADSSSFRIEGTEGELGVFCRHLGVSGPADLAITSSEWQNRRSYSFTSDDDVSVRRENEYGVGLATAGSPRVFEDGGNHETIERRCVELSNGVVLATAGSARVFEDGSGLETDETIERRHVETGNGIKGLRPPLLVPPPPATSRMIVDDVGSIWDLIKSFAPEDNENLASDETDDNNAGEIIEMMASRIDAIVPPSGSDRSGQEDEGFSSLSVEVQYPLSTTGSLRGSFRNWQKGEFLGSGSFGTVYECFNELGELFAVKEVSVVDVNSMSIFQLEHEISLLSQLRHENIVRYLGTDTDDGKLYIFLELVPKGSLANHCQKYELRDSQVSAYTRQILSGLNYLHERKVVHRDIKCANILVDASGSVKLADFGLTKATTLNDI